MLRQLNHVEKDDIDVAAGAPAGGGGISSELRRRASAMAESTTIDAFGGAIGVSAPGGWLDASDVRPVPDHQEVWLERAATARALIVELLELAADAADGDAAARLHFEELASSNDAEGSAVHQNFGLGDAAAPRLRPAPPAPPQVLRGVQSLAEGARLHVWLAVVRLPRVGTDLVVSISRPVADAAAEGVAATEDLELLRAVVASLEVRDWSLFGGGAAEESEEAPT